jgi:hypothetical protein
VRTACAPGAAVQSDGQAYGHDRRNGKRTVRPWLLLDVVCGAALGVVIGSCLNLAVGVPARAVGTVRRDVSPTA